MASERLHLPNRNKLTGVIAWIVVVAAAGSVLIGFTGLMGQETYLAFLAPYRYRIMSGELAIMGVLLVELMGNAFMRYFRQEDVLQVGMAIRAVVRVVGYSILFISVLSVLSASTALAVGVGSTTGIVIGLATQSVLGNVVAGMILAIMRPLKLDSEITVTGLTGRVARLGAIYTILDLGDREALVPNTVILTSAIQRKKEKGSA